MLVTEIDTETVNGVTVGMTTEEDAQEGNVEGKKEQKDINDIKILAT